MSNGCVLYRHKIAVVFLIVAIIPAIVLHSQVLVLVTDLHVDDLVFPVANLMQPLQDQIQEDFNDEPELKKTNGPRIQEDHHHEGESEVTIWTKEPVKTKYIVTRKLEGTFQKIIQVHFRTCIPSKNGDCPSTTPQEAHNESAFIVNNASSIVLYERNETRSSQSLWLEKRRMNSNVISLSYWSSALKRHVVFVRGKKIAVRSCSADGCPKVCLRKKGRFPYEWDSRDLLCKSTDPTVQRYGGFCDCRTTCYTPQANEPNSTWPWKDDSERNFFHPPGEKRFKFWEFREGIRKRKKHVYTPRFACKNASQSSLELPRPIFVSGENHFFFIPEAKLMFCGIPKVGISEWLKFLRFTRGARDFLSLPHNKHDRIEFLVSSLSIEKAQELLNDPSWTRAVFFRDPAERLLSTYFDKIIGEEYMRTKFNRDTMTFAEFIDLISSNETRHMRFDPHWRPQTMICGLDYLLPHFDFVGSLDHVAEHTKLLLDRVGIWETYGAKYDDGKDLKTRHASQCAVTLEVDGKHRNATGFNQRGPSTADHDHSTGSKNLLDEYYTPELLAKVRKLYYLDYAVWDDLQRRGASDVPKGSDLHVVQSYCHGSQL